MKEAKTEKELLELIRDYIERESNGDLADSAWFTVTPWAAKSQANGALLTALTQPGFKMC